MNFTSFILLLCYITVFVRGEIGDTKDIENPEDLERRHRKHRRPQNSGPCGSGYGRTFGFQDYTSTYISAPVMNYFFGCGAAPVPVAPYPQLPAAGGYPVQVGVSQAQHHGGHGGHHGGHGGINPGSQFGGGYPAGYGQPNFGQGSFQQPNRPFQNIVSAAASGFGNVLADYVSRPRKTQKQINRQVNQFLKPIYKLF